MAKLRLELAPALLHRGEALVSDTLAQGVIGISYSVPEIGP